MHEKDMLLLDSQLSPTRTDSVTEMIARLNREIARGEAVYAPEELEKLVTKLQEYELLLERLTS